jgi:hypothetical protein
MKMTNSRLMPEVTDFSTYGEQPGLRTLLDRVEELAGILDATEDSDCLALGTFSSSTAGYGIALSSTRTKALDVCCDDNGAALTAGTSYRPIRGRMLVSYAQSGDTSIFGIQGHLKNKAVDTSTGQKAGVWGYYEAISGATVAANSAGVYAMIDVPSGATIGGTIGGLQIGSNDLGGTHTAKAASIHMPNPVSGTWDYGLVFGDTTGATAANTHSIDSHALAFIIKIRVGNTDAYIPAFAAVPA